MKVEIAVAAVLAVAGAQAEICTFDDLPYNEGEEYWNGSDEAGGFVDGDAIFMNNYNAEYKSWDGFSYSKVNDTTTSGWENQYASYTGTDFSGTGNYVVGYAKSVLSLGAVTGDDYDRTVKGAYFANTTYAARSMLYGDSYAKKFGGETGDDEDYFKLIITGVTESGYTAERVEFYLADYRFADDSRDYIVDEWTWVDLSGLGNVVGLEFELESSDNGTYGMNTPSYFAMDSFNIVPEPSTIALMGTSGIALFATRRRLRIC